jgi:hypothetical protein
MSGGFRLVIGDTLTPEPPGVSLREVACLACDTLVLGALSILIATTGAGEEWTAISLGSALYGLLLALAHVARYCAGMPLFARFNGALAALARNLREHALNTAAPLGLLYLLRHEPPTPFRVFWVLRLLAAFWLQFGPAREGPGPSFIFSRLTAALSPAPPAAAGAAQRAAPLQLTAFLGGSLQLPRNQIVWVGMPVEGPALITLLELLANAVAVRAVAAAARGAAAAAWGGASAAAAAAAWAVAAAGAAAAATTTPWGALSALLRGACALPPALAGLALAPLGGAWAWATAPVYSRLAAVVGFPLCWAAAAAIFAFPALRLVATMAVGVALGLLLGQARALHASALRGAAAFARGGWRARGVALLRAAAAAAYLHVAGDLCLLSIALLVAAEAALRAVLLPALPRLPCGGRGADEAVPLAQGGAPGERRAVGAWRTVAAEASARGAARGDAPCPVRVFFFAPTKPFASAPLTAPPLTP